MKLAIMQPYFLPYIGYWQLLQCVDRFVIYDDVNYIKGGWVNRNRILIDETPFWLSIPIAKASPNRAIYDHSIVIDDRWKKKTIRTIAGAYRRAPFFHETQELFERILAVRSSGLSLFLTEQIKIICQHLAIDTEIVTSSRVYDNKSLKGQDRIIDICRKEACRKYVNSAGGAELYSRDVFALHGLELAFLTPRSIMYSQFKGESFSPNLSILDVLMFNGVAAVQNLLDDYDLV